MRKLAGLLLATLVAFAPLRALALTGGTNISVTNGTVAVTGTIGVANGGTGVNTWTANNSVVLSGTSGTGAVQLVSGATAGNVLVSAGTGTAPTFTTINLASANAVGSSILPIANGGTNASSFTSGRCVRFNGTSLVSATADCATPQTPVLDFGPGMDVTTSQTLYMNLAGHVDSTEAVVASPQPAATFANIRCFNSGIQGNTNNITITGQTGTCGSALTGAGSPGVMTCTINGAASNTTQTCSDTTNTVSTTAAQCLDFKIVTPATLTANGRINCSIERTA